MVQSSPGFHHPGPEGGRGRSTGAGRKWSLGVWDLTATLYPSERQLPCQQSGDLTLASKGGCEN